MAGGSSSGADLVGRRVPGGRRVATVTVVGKGKGKGKAKAKTKVKAVKPKAKCCKEQPRCKRCPTVLRRLEKEGLAERRDDGRYAISPDLKKKQLKAARRWRNAA